MDQSFTTDQMDLLNAVKHGTFRNVMFSFKPEYLEKNDKWFDYLLLVTALQRKHKTIINFLLKYDCRVRRETRTDSFHTPLHYAVEIGDSSIVKKLLKKGASINDKHLTSKTPLYLAVQEQKSYIADLMLTMSDFEDDSPTNNDAIAHFHIACMRNKHEFVKKFVKCGFPINSSSVLEIEEWRGFTPLHFAVNNRSSEMFTYLLNNKADFSVKNVNGCTPLHLAYYNNNVVILSSAIDLAFSLHEKNYVNPVDDKGLSHFHISCTINVPKNVEIFINHKAAINSFISMDSAKHPGYAPLHFAVQYLCIDVVELLLKRGAEVNQTAKGGFTPLHLACHFNSIKIVELLLRYHASVDAIGDKNRTPLHCAFYKRPKSDKLIDLILPHIPRNVNPTDSRGLSHFHIACTRNDLKIVQDLLNCGASVDSCIDSDKEICAGYSALHFAVNYNQKNVVELLLQNDAKVDIAANPSKITPLHLVCMFNQDKFYEIVEAYQKDNKDIDCTSSRKNQIEIVELLLSHTADTNSEDSFGKTPLIYTCENNISNILFNSEQSCYFHYIPKFYENLCQELINRQKEIIDILLLHNANIYICTNTNESILHSVIKSKNSETSTTKLAKFLLENCAPVNVADDKGRTPLHLAVECCNLKLVEVLLAHNANINVKTSERMTPLHLAVQYLKIYNDESDPIIDILLKHGSDVNAQNAIGDTPLHMSMSFHNEKPVIEALLQHGADINCENAEGSPAVIRFYKRLVDSRREFSTRDKSIIDLIELHLKKLFTIGFHINEKIKKYYCQLNFINDFVLLRESDDFLIQCNKELERLKNVKIDSYSSLHDILFKDQNEMVKHIKNESLSGILAGDNLEDQFPLYGYLLKVQFRRGLVRSTLLKPAKDSLHFVLGFSLPDSCSETILRYLINEDLEDLIKVDTFLSCLKRKLNFDIAKNNESLEKQPRLE